MSLLARTRASVYTEDAVTSKIIVQLTRSGVELDIAVAWTAYLVRRAMRDWHSRRGAPS
jgi:hypothetical protein